MNRSPGAAFAGARVSASTPLVMLLLLLLTLASPAVGVAAAPSGRPLRLSLAADRSSALGGPAVEVAQEPGMLYGDPQAGYNPNLTFAGFCKSSDGAPACSSPPCCCWSTFSGLDSVVAPNQAKARFERKCLNPPAGYDYVPDPGEGVSRETGFKGQFKKAGYPMWEGRKLCCLAPKNDVSRLSQANPFEKSADDKEPAVQSAPLPDYT
mmetsp:Transcript_11725/g.31421  ORF Transcript_11725/g.31421 Transcript_11725/m.31421 type:complete len:209 (+) Transcript_11725:165-791(+)